MRFCAHAGGDRVGYELPIHSRGSVCMDVNPDTEWLLSDYVFEPDPDLLVVNCEEKEKPDVSLIASRIASLPVVSAARVPDPREHWEFSARIFFPWLAGSEFRQVPGSPRVSWLAKLYSVEKAAGEMTILEAFIVDRWELAGISKGMITALLKERPLKRSAASPGASVPEECPAFPGGQSTVGFLRSRQTDNHGRLANLPSSVSSVVDVATAASRGSGQCQRTKWLFAAGIING